MFDNNNRSDGISPIGSLIQGSDGNLYGMTAAGGTYGDGTVFKLAPNGTGFSFSTLHAFSGSDGDSPRSALLQGNDGNLYGMTYQGGPSGGGTVFKLAPNGTISTLHAFLSRSDGATPNAAFIQGSDGNLYGTTYQGGPSGGGIVFKLAPDGSDFSTLHAFLGGSEGTSPIGALLQGSDSNLYGTTNYGGAYGYGTVFTFAPDGSGFSTLYTFSGSDGTFPNGSLLQGADGNLYGMTSGFGDCTTNPDPFKCGTVFALAPGGTLTTLHIFSGSDGSGPQAGLLQGIDGNLYGTTYHGGASDAGTVFKLAPDGSGFSTLRTFSGFDGATPEADLIQGIDGNLYGTTATGGASNIGTVFTLAPDGTGFSTLHAFSDSDGTYATSGLVQGSDGNLYGTTPWGGASDAGTVFKLAPNGTLTTIHTFSGSDGAHPYFALLQGSDGNLYGTTEEGGAGALGVVFRLQPPETLTVSLAGPGSGTVTSEPAGISCPGTCSAAFPIGTLVTLTATPATNWAFTGWSGACAGTGSCSLKLSSDMVVTARFGIPTYTITASAGPNGSISPSGAATVTRGNNQSFTIAPNLGYKVLNVLVDGSPVGAVTTYSFSNVQANHSIAASFALSWSGVLQPINADGSSVFKLGSTIPVKFQLTGVSAGITNLAAKISIAQVNAGIVGSALEAVSTSAADSGNTFRYDSTTGQYIFNLATKPLSQGTWQIRIDLGDGTLNTVQISLKK